MQNPRRSGAEAPRVAGVAGNGDGAVGPAPIDAPAVRAELQRIFASPAFEATERLRAFLAYVVEEALAGRADRIKAFTIATDLFGRDSSFDAHIDPIVRIEAGRLRRALERYYLTAGRDDPVVISIPKGRYAPAFDHAAAPARAAAQSLSLRRGLVVAGLVACAALLIAWAGLRIAPEPQRAVPLLPRLAVMPFEDHARSEGSREIASGLRQEVVDQIVRFKDVVAVEVGAKEGEDKPAALARYALAGSVDVEGRRLRVRARVLDVSEGSVLWSEVYDGDLDAASVLDLETRIATRLAAAVAQPYGVIHRAAAAAAPVARADAEAYRCTLRYYVYRAELDTASHPAVRDCLEKTVVAFPDYSTAWALLSQSYIDEIRFHYAAAPGAEPATMATALAAARRAVALDPRNVRALQAEMLALAFAGDIDAGLSAGRQAMAINPDDAELAGEFGFRLAMSGAWHEGCALIERARSSAPGPVEYFEAALSLCAYVRGDAHQAVAWAERSTMPQNPTYHMIALLAYVEAGMMPEARRERDWVVANAPRFATDLAAEVEKRFVRPEDRARIMKSAAEVGLPVPPAPAPGG